MPGDQFEAMVDRFVVDIIRDDLSLEIRTRNFASIKSKMKNLAHSHRVRLIYPVAQDKWIVKLTTGGNSSTTHRKSPKRRRVEDLFYERVSFPQLLENLSFSMEVLLTKEEEISRFEGKRKWRTGRWAQME